MLSVLVKLERCTLSRVFLRISGNVKMEKSNADHMTPVSSKGLKFGQQNLWSIIFISQNLKNSFRYGIIIAHLFLTQTLCN